MFGSVRETEPNGLPRKRSEVGDVDRGLRGSMHCVGSDAGPLAAVPSEAWATGTTTVRGVRDRSHGTGRE